jgi:hypothetical protein
VGGAKAHLVGMNAKDFPMPDLGDMRQMLRLASRLHELPPMRRALAWMGGVAALIHADWGAAWVGEGESVVRWRTVGENPLRYLDDDPAAGLIARSQRKRTPVVRFRDELVAAPLWEATAHSRIRGAVDSIYSLHREAGAMSLVVFYRSADRDPWTERERGILQLMHAQCARCMIVDIAS